MNLGLLTLKSRLSIVAASQGGPIHISITFHVNASCSTCITENCTSKDQAQYFGWYQESIGRMSLGTLGRKGKTPNSARIGGDGWEADLWHCARALGRGQASRWREIPLLLGHGCPCWASTPAQPWDDGLRLSSNTSGLSDRPKPLASVFPSVSWEGLSTLG